MVQAICGAIERGWVCSLYPQHTDAHVYSVRSHRHALAVSDTMRELAAVAGLALWVERTALLPPIRVLESSRRQLAVVASALGWEAPDA